MPKPITASMLYNYVQCPRRVSLDLYGDPADKDKVSAFVQLLWDRGNAFEREVIEGLKVPFTDLSALSDDAKEEATKEAMTRGDGLIYSGRIRSNDLLGEPDLLRRQGEGYAAGDIKSGAGEEGAEPEDKKPKKHYAVQLALYTDILERIGMSAGRVPFVWDIHAEEIVYDLDALQGTRNPTALWSVYQEVLDKVAAISHEKARTLPAYSGICKLCQWRTVCLRALTETKDLTLIPELGRAKRDAMMSHIKDINKLADADISTLIRGGKTVVPGIGPDTLRKFQARARLQVRKGRPVLTGPLDLPSHDLEIFFDIETDPMQDICYLHGFVERRNNDGAAERFISFYADDPTPEQEKRAFASAWEYIKASRPCMIYYYSKYERTIWRKLREKYPDVMTAEEVEEMFSPENSVDLYYDVVRSKTEWPTRDYSIKTLASYLGFSWRDTDPSGASSIEWYHQWVK
ncbi:MAG: TM0106 family RecB-like putative nuclease, partial [Nitrospirota bacterium]|nr:TM0106 family RecB-like putative nuclease [Nitrospirota bacterium]